MKNTVFIFMVALGLSESLRAEALLETLIVTGKASAASPLIPSVVRAATADRLPGVRIDSAELLQTLPGVQADSRSNYAQDTRITLRGFGARSAFGVRGIDLLVDGVPLTTPDGQGQLSSVALDGIDSLEVLRGPLAALYGNGAGGVISLQTQAPEDSSFGVRSLVGEDGTRRQALSGQWRQGQVGARVQGSRFVTDGVRPHASAERQHGGAQFYYTSTGGVETRLRLDVSRDPLLQDPLGLTPEQWQEDPNQLNPVTETFDTRKEVAHRQLSLSLRQVEGPGRWQASAWDGQRDIIQYLGFTGAPITNAGGVVDLERHFRGLGGNYSWDLPLAAGQLTATLGAELTRSEDRRRGYVNDFGEPGELRRDELGEVRGRDVYSLLQWQPQSPWEVYGGLRHSHLRFTVDDYFVVPGNPDDSGSRDYNHWSTAWGVNYQITRDWTAHASLGRGFETPTLTEMAYRSEGTGLNLDLQAAQNRQQELGINFRAPEGLEYSLTVFAVDSTHELVVDQSVGGRTSFRNAAATERHGVEISGQAPLAEAWHLWLNLNYLAAEYTEGEWRGMRLPGVARHNHYAQLRWQPLLDERLTLGLGVQQRSKVATADNNQTFASGASTADLALSSRQGFGYWDVYAWVKAANLTDETYVGSVIVNQANGRAFEAAPERRFSAGLELNYRW